MASTTIDALLIKIKVKLKLSTSDKSDNNNNNFLLQNNNPDFEFIVDEQIIIDDIDKFDFYSVNNFDFAILQQNEEYVYLVNDLGSSNIIYIEKDKMNDLYQYLCQLFSKDIFQNSIDYNNLYLFLNDLKLGQNSTQNTNVSNIFTSGVIKTDIMNHYNAVNQYRNDPKNKLFNQIVAITDTNVSEITKKDVITNLSDIKNILFDDFVNEYKPVIIQNISNDADWNAFIDKMKIYKTKKESFYTRDTNMQKISSDITDSIKSILNKSNVDDGVMVYLKLNNKDVKPNDAITKLVDKSYNYKRFGNINMSGDKKVLHIQYNCDNNTYNYNSSSINKNNTSETDLTKYTFGNFNKIFLPTQKNSNIVNDMNDIVDKVVQGNPVFIIGYGASGAGKTSSLIYLKTTKINDQGDHFPYTENGVLPELCLKIIKKYQDNNQVISNVKVQTFEFYESDYTKIKENGPPQTIIETSGVYEFDSGLKLKEGFVYTNKHSYIVGNTTKQFNTGEQLGDIITHLVDTDRYVKATTNNPQSSRSHVLVFVHFCGNENKTISQIIVGDFAGVENQFQCRDTDVLDKFLNIEKTDGNKFYKAQMNSTKSNDNDRYDHYSGGSNDTTTENKLSEVINKIDALNKEHNKLEKHIQLLNNFTQFDNNNCKLSKEIFTEIIKELDEHPLDINNDIENLIHIINNKVVDRLKPAKDFFDIFDNIILNNPYNQESKINYSLSNKLYKSISNNLTKDNKNIQDMAYPTLLSDTNYNNIIEAINKLKDSIEEIETNYSANQNNLNRVDEAIYKTSSKLITNYYNRIKDDMFGVYDDSKKNINRSKIETIILDLIQICEYITTNKKYTLNGTIKKSIDSVDSVKFNDDENKLIIRFHYFLISLFSLKRNDSFTRHMLWENATEKTQNSFEIEYDETFKRGAPFKYYLDKTKDEYIVTFSDYNINRNIDYTGDKPFFPETKFFYEKYTSAIKEFINSIYSIFGANNNISLSNQLSIIKDNIINQGKYEEHIGTIKYYITNNFVSKTTAFTNYIPILDDSIKTSNIADSFKQIDVIKSIVYSDRSSFILYKKEIQDALQINNNNNNNISFFIDNFIEIIKKEVLKYVYIYYSCNFRVTEGKYINRSLKIMRNTIGTIVRSKLKNFYNYLDECYEQYILDFKRLPSSRGSTSQDKIIKTIFENMLKMEKFKDKKDDELMKNLSICIFGVLNITKDANNPPKIPYVDINDLKTIIKTKQYDNIKSTLSTLKELLSNWKDLHEANIKQLEEIITKIGNNYLDPTDYDTINDLIDIKDNIDNLNASSAIGTLEFLDQIVKLNSTNILCRDPASKK